MTNKTFIALCLSIISVVVIAIGGFNYYIDPMWLFNHENDKNSMQVVIDERQQKTNHIHFSRDFDYDTLLIGSSRSTYINQHDFTGMNVYNFAVSDMSVREYDSFIEFAKEEKGSEFKNIIIGVDFFKTSTEQSSEAKSLQPNIDRVNEPFYRYKSLLSFDMLEYSKRNMELSEAGDIVLDRSYDRENVASAKHISPESTKIQTEEKIQKFRDVFYGETYEYNPQYKEILQEIKDHNPNTNFIVFTTPISSALFDALVDEGREPDYQQWLADIEDVFGEVHNFMGYNEITTNPNNYFDGHHFYPEVGTMIAKKLSAEYEKQTTK